MEARVHHAIEALKRREDVLPPSCEDRRSCKLAEILATSTEPVADLKEFYKRERLAMRLFFFKVVLGGAALMMVAANLCARIPTTTFVHGRTDNAAYLLTPLLYAAGTAVLGSTLFHDVYDHSGVVSSIRALADRRVALGAAVAFALMVAGSLDWNNLCGFAVRDDAAHPSVADLLTSDTSLLVSVVLNFLGDAFMVQQSFEYKQMRETRQIVKILVDNVILVAVLAARAKQRRASARTIFAYSIALCLMYVFCVAVGVGMTYVRSESFQAGLKHFNKGFVPMVLLWTLLFELAPNVFRFQTEGSEDASARSLYAQRHIVVAAFGVGLFYASSSLNGN